MEKLLRANPDVVVIVDEAYVDFGAQSAVPLIDKYPNLLVVQTASKSRALAGLRVGWAMGHQNLIHGLRCVRDSINSYTVDRLAQAGLRAAIEDEDYFQSIRRRVMDTRAWTVTALKEMGFTVLPSQANFLFVSRPGPEREGAAGRPAGAGRAGTLVGGRADPGLAAGIHRHGRRNARAGGRAQGADLIAL